MPKSRVIFLGAQGGTWIIFKHWQHDKCTTSPTIELKKSSKKKLRLKISFWLSVLSPFFFDQFVRLTILHILRCCQPLTTGFLVSINFFSPTDSIRMQWNDVNNDVTVLRPACTSYGDTVLQYDSTIRRACWLVRHDVISLHSNRIHSSSGLGTRESGACFWIHLGTPGTCTLLLSTVPGMSFQTVMHK